MSDLITEIVELRKNLDEAIEQANQYGMALAVSEEKYQVRKRQKALLEKDEGIPVTFINQFLNGDSEIAELRRLRDIDEALYRTALEKINSYKLQIRVVDAQISREWTSAGDSFYSA